MNKHYWNRYLKFIEWCDQTQIWIGETYTEKHHIIPRCFGGDNSKDNLIRLPYRAHLLAHRLLYKAIPCRETAFAFNAMVSTPSTHRNEKVNSRFLEFIRKVFHSYNKEMGEVIWRCEERRKTQSKKLKEYWSDQENRDKQSENLKKLWQNEDYRKIQKEARKDCWNDERKMKQSEVTTEVNNRRWAKPENKKKQSENVKKALSKRTKKEKRIQCLRINISRWEKWLEQGYLISKKGKHPLSDEKRASIIDKIELAKDELKLLK